MKTPLLIVLLFTSQFVFATSNAELECVAKSTYHEARNLKPNDWVKVANVAYNRSKSYEKYKYGAKSKHLCDIVRSKEYSTRHKLRSKIAEPEVYKEILTTLKRSNWKTSTNAVYFETRKGKMKYSR